MNANRSRLLCGVAVSFVTATAAQPSTEVVRTNLAAARTNSVLLVQSTGTNQLLQVLRPDGTFTNFTCGRLVHTTTNVLFEWVRSDGVLTNIVFGRAHPPFYQGQPTKVDLPRSHPVLGDFWLPGEFEDRLKQRKEAREPKTR